jgi:hypothetical protein
MRVGSLWRSKVGWVLAALYVVIFAVAYADYLRKQGTWLADLGLGVLVIPYILAGRLITLDPTFEFHGDQPWALVPALICCTALAYFFGLALDRSLRRISVGLRRGYRSPREAGRDGEPDRDITV